MSNPYNEQDDRFFPSSSAQPATDDQHQHHHQQHHAVSPVDSLEGYGELTSDNDKVMEMIGITSTTFSSNIQFEVPRFMRDAFDPAVLHSTSSSVPPLSYTLPSSSNQQHGNIQRNVSDISIDYAGTRNTYTPQYQPNSANADTSASPAFGDFNFPPSALYPPLSIHQTSYSSGQIPNHTPADGALSPTHPPVRPPPRSSTLALNGLPIYSASGFDMMDILARIATRPQPKIQLGPVDMTCSFLVVDITRDDSPIIYASQTFSELTGYQEAEILGKNCRFLQAPPGQLVEKGAQRPHTDMDSVTQMAQNVAQNRECQVTLVNYKSNGEAFINCVSIIPVIPGGNEPVRYHVGFQVDLALQPLAIMKSVQNGSYITNYSSTPLPPVLYQSGKLNVRALSKDMADMLGRMDSSGSSSGSNTPLNETQDRQKLSMALLSECPDAIFVVSLKGSFLYVSPSVARLLKYDADFFLNKNLADICHPSDLAPTMRNVKESSLNAGSVVASQQQSSPNPSGQDIELLFRARRSDGTYIWLDCPGKLHSDTSRGRKALLLRLREIDLPRVTWQTINTAGGVNREDCYLRVARDDRGLIVACLKGAEGVLGRSCEDLIGNALADMVVDDDVGTKRDAISQALRVGDLACGEVLDDRAPRVVYCNIPTKSPKKANGAGEERPPVALLTAEIAFFPPLCMKPGEDVESPGRQPGNEGWRRKPQTLIVRIRVHQRQTIDPVTQQPMSIARNNSTRSTSDSAKVLPSAPGPSSMPSVHIPGGGMFPEATQEPFFPLGREATSPTRRNGYQVRQDGNVNVIDDTVHSSNRPSIHPLPPLLADGSASFGSNAPEVSPTVASSGAGLTSSWQYELQQLRIKNEKLRAEVAAANKERRAKKKDKGPARSSIARYDGLANRNVPDRQIPVAMSWTSTSPFASSSSGIAGPSRSVSYPHGSMQPPHSHPSSSAPHGFSDGHKRTWSQTEMHSEWGY